MIRITDQYIWNIVFTLFFLGVVTMVVIILDGEARMAYEDLTVLDISLMALATYRLTRLFVNDHITKWFREQFWDTEENRGKILLVKPERGPRRTIADLLACPWCFGMWAATIVVFFYLLTPMAFVPVLLLAVSGVGSWLHQIGQLTGHKAEQLQRQLN